MTNRDRDRICFFTEHFNDLQGLRYWVPLGLVALSGAACFASRMLALVLFLGAVFLTVSARRYYRGTLGEVEREPVAELCSLSVFSPAGPTPRLEGFQRVTPAVQQFLATLGLIFALIFALQVISPTIIILESQFEQPWVTLDAIYEAEPSWTRGIGSVIAGAPAQLPPLRILSAQMIYTLFGSVFLSLWLWRKRQSSQSYHVALAALLLGLSAFGGSLGFFVYEDRWMAVRAINLLLPTVTHLWLALLLCGSSMILAGLLDHRQLGRALETSD
ncbi:MAG TPA: hypothetical protein VLE27_01870 [Thermoanaerobaculia bacterium]|nr:hypothetical protein [Thermoanaerobaculia bacterium]